MVLLLLSVNTALSQDFKVKVSDINDDPLPYVFVTVNNAGVGVTDTLGVAVVKKEFLYGGDTLGVSLVGMEPQYVVCGADMLKEGTYTFVLKEGADYIPDEVLGKPNDALYLFRRYVDASWLIDYAHLLKSDFYIKKHDGSNVKGTFTMLHTPPHLCRDTLAGNNYYDKYFPVELLSVSDTSGTGVLKDMLRNTVFRARLTIALSGADRNNEWSGKPVVDYLGIRDNIRVFRLAYEEVKDAKFTLQSIIHVDKKTKELRYIYTALMSEDNSIHTYEINMVKHKDKNSKAPKTMVMSDVEWEINYDGRNVWNVSLGNMEYKYLTTKGYKKK